MSYLYILRYQSWVNNSQSLHKRLNPTDLQELCGSLVSLLPVVPTLCTYKMNLCSTGQSKKHPSVWWLKQKLRPSQTEFSLLLFQHLQSSSPAKGSISVLLKCKRLSSDAEQTGLTCCWQRQRMHLCHSVSRGRNAEEVEKGNESLKRWGNRTKTYSGNVFYTYSLYFHSFQSSSFTLSLVFRCTL